VSSGIRLWFFAFPLILLWSNGIDNLFYFWFNMVPTDQMAVQVVKAAEANPKLLYTLIAFVTLLVPFLEELLFRGFLQNSLRGVIGPVFAVIITSFFFAFFHFSPEQGLTNITFVSSLFILSCFLGFLMEKKKTVWAPMALHAFFNLMSILFILGRNYFA
jgi:membrane protease YdiL (CAAX protease family)